MTVEFVLIVRTAYVWRPCRWPRSQVRVETGTYPRYDRAQAETAGVGSSVRIGLAGAIPRAP